MGLETKLPAFTSPRERAGCRRGCPARRCLRRAAGANASASTLTRRPCAVENRLGCPRRKVMTAKQEPGRQHAGSGNATILVPVSFGVELLVPVREAEFKARRLNFEFGDPDGPFDGYFIFAGSRPPLTFSSSSSRNSRTCVARPSFELSLLLLMFFSIKPANGPIQSLVRPRWRNARRHCKPVHWRHLNRHFCDGHHVNRRPCQRRSCDGRHGEIASTRRGWQRIKNDADNATLALWMETIMMFVTRACLAASAVLCCAIDPGAAQYNVFGTPHGRNRKRSTHAPGSCSSLKTGAKPVLPPADGGWT